MLRHHVPQKLVELSAQINFALVLNRTNLALEIYTFEFLREYIKVAFFHPTDTEANNTTF